MCFRFLFCVFCWFFFASWLHRKSLFVFVFCESQFASQSFEMQHKTPVSGSPFTIAWPSTAIPTFLATSHGNTLLPTWNAEPMQSKTNDCSTSDPVTWMRTSRACLLLLATLLLLLLIAMGACLANLLWLVSAPNNPTVDQLSPPFVFSNSIDLPTTVRHPIRPNVISNRPSTTTVPSSTSIATNIDQVSPSSDPESNDEDGFGESIAPINTNESSTFAQSNSSSPSSASSSSSEDESLIDFFRRFNSTTNDSNGVSARNRSSSTVDPLNGEFVDHRTMSNDELEEMSSEFFDHPPELESSNDSGDLLSFGESPPASSSSSVSSSPAIDSTGSSNGATQNVSNHFKEDAARAEFGSIPLNRFCSSSGSACAHLENCSSKFIILATVQSNLNGSSNRPSASKVEQTYTIHVQQAIRRSPLLSVALRRSQLHVQLDLTAATDNDLHFTSDRCSSASAMLQPGRTYLISGRVSGLHAISQNCDLRIDWDRDVSDSQRQRLTQLLSHSRTPPIEYC